MVMRCFEMAFRRGSRLPGDSVDDHDSSQAIPFGPVNVVDTHVFEVALEIREEDSKVTSINSLDAFSRILERCLEWLFSSLVVRNERIRDKCDEHLVIDYFLLFWLQLSSILLGISSTVNLMSPLIP